MGGATSHDKEYREAVLNLQAHDNAVDYVITHCAPDSIQWEIASYYEIDKLNEFLEAVKNEIGYKHWYFGHYHLNEDIDDKHTCVFDKIIQVGCPSENLMV